MPGIPGTEEIMNMQDEIRKKWNALSEEKKKACLERFGGDCFEEIEEDLIHSYVYMLLKKAIE
jgi:hypothetical protein